MSIITETPDKDTSGNKYYYTPIDDLLSIPGANIGSVAVNGSTHGYTHVNGASAFWDYDTYQANLTVGEQYRLVLTPDVEENFYSNEIAWVQDASGTDVELLMNVIGSTSTYIDGSLYSDVFEISETGAHYFSVNFSVPYDKQLSGSVADFGYTITLMRIGPSILNGNGRANTLIGDSGQNIISGLGGNDTLKGLGDADTLKGGRGADLLNGGNGKDSLFGDAGNDRLLGGADDDILNGGAGKDRLDGGSGADTLTGGKGADIFIFSSAKQAQGDKITDFHRAEGDVINLSKIDADTGQRGDQAFDLIGDTGFSGTAGELRAWTSKGNTFIAGDVDGDGKADFQIKLEGLFTLVDADFLL
ncbi:calcium-binding protein [Pseudodonghicola sp.]|uniref:calcium-binding protein n=1 Tax=Pseudodonghicola sp. TaxID=1969463 RepID=UPI003A97D9A6